jgi:uncharacterized protein YecE (DUF72 family)
MEFGKVEEKELNKIDFTLPAEPAFNEKILKGKPVAKPQVYMGCAKWGRSEWVGSLYPLKTKEKDFLENYVQHYNSIELNATHYKIYGADMIQKWSDKAGAKDFKFCPKMYKGVTHFGSLKGKEALSDEFLKGVIEFKEHLGPVFIQVSESFSPARKEELFDYLKTLPTDLQFFVEVRHPEWFYNPAISEEYFSTLKKLKMGAVITDAAGRRDCAHMYLTLPKTFIRYVGNSLHKTDYTRIDEWVERVKFWLDNGLKELYFFMHMHNEALSPQLTAYLTDKLNAACGLDLQKPMFIPKQKGLFD